ncbi:hypothetical protein J4Q44_G00327090 [Coregonus suidteri]|uniref:Secreted protein n=1 Tax=Coregonus suidteri TaxID=861788 RepID=A0AAN8KPX8_9TELE
MNTKRRPSQAASVASPNLLSLLMLLSGSCWLMASCWDVGRQTMTMPACRSRMHLGRQDYLNPSNVGELWRTCTTHLATQLHSPS